MVLALSTPYYAVADAGGTVVLRGVPPGSYSLHMWSETAEPIDPAAAARIVQVATGPVHLGELVLKTTANPMQHHKNKFGEDYLPEHQAPY